MWAPHASSRRSTTQAARPLLLLQVEKSPLAASFLAGHAADIAFAGIRVNIRIRLYGSGRGGGAMALPLIGGLSGDGPALGSQRVHFTFVGRRVAASKRSETELWGWRMCLSDANRMAHAKGTIPKSCGLEAATHGFFLPNERCPKICTGTFHPI